MVLGEKLEILIGRKNALLDENEDIIKFVGDLFLEASQEIWHKNIF